MQIHNIDPIYNENSKILILGSFPSVKSRDEGFFYAHPQNRFWKVISRIFDKDGPKNIEEKKALLLACNIAVWDVIKSCEIEGSSDSSIKNIELNDINKMIKSSNIKAVYANGGLAGKLYNKHIFKKTNHKAKVLPSTSPANAAYSLERLCSAWQEIRNNM